MRPERYLIGPQDTAHDAVLICDEVMTGFGRPGEWFDLDRFDAQPDITRTAKGLTGSYQHSPPRL